NRAEAITSVMSFGATCRRGLQPKLRFPANAHDETRQHKRADRPQSRLRNRFHREIVQVGKGIEIGTLLGVQRASTGVDVVLIGAEEEGVASTIHIGRIGEIERVVVETKKPAGSYQATYGRAVPLARNAEQRVDTAPQIPGIEESRSRYSFTAIRESELLR